MLGLIFLINIIYSKDCKGVFLDAGSSSTKISIFEYPCVQAKQMPNLNLSQTFSPEKMSIGISKLNLNNFQDYFDEIFQKVENNLGPISEEYPIILTATAGMRILPKNEQVQRMDIIKQILRNSKFKFHDDWCQIIQGDKEGAFLWMTIRHIKDPNDFEKIYLTLDMGGASTQISINDKLKIYDIVNINILNHNYSVFSNSFLNYGNDLARQHIIDNNSLIKQTKLGLTELQNPCFYKGFQKSLNQTHVLTGTGENTLCQQHIKEFFQIQNDKCFWNSIGICKIIFIFYQFQECTIQNNYLPLINKDTFIYAASGYFFVARFLKLDQCQFSLQTLKEKVEQSNIKSWQDIQIDNPDTDPKFLENQFFINTYAYSLIKDGYHFQDNQMIHSLEKIQGITPTYAPGAFIYYMSNYECRDGDSSCQKIQFF